MVSSTKEGFRCLCWGLVRNCGNPLGPISVLFSPRAGPQASQENRCWLVMDLARGGDLHNKVFEELNISINRGRRRENGSSPCVVGMSEL